MHACMHEDEIGKDASDKSADKVKKDRTITLHRQFKKVRRQSVGRIRWKDFKKRTKIKKKSPMQRMCRWMTIKCKKMF